MFQQILWDAQFLENRYRKAAENTPENDIAKDYIYQYGSIPLPLRDHEERVKSGLLELIGGYETVVADSMAICRESFSSARTE